MELVLSPLAGSGDRGEVELVEHKGIGHPDTMCDALSEAFGLALAKLYLERFGSLLHFNVDKALLCGGAARPALGGGEVLAPIRLILAGRATREARGLQIPVEEVAVESARRWVREHLHALDADRHLEVQCLARGGSSELVDLFRARGALRGASWLANDTSFGVGFAPLSELERTVLAAAKRLRELARERPEVGEDVKVMGMRLGTRVHLTVACAFVGRYLEDLSDYSRCREQVAEEVRLDAEKSLGRAVTVAVNTADDVAAGRAYYTVTGTSAEAGDDGQVGRGNRVNGLITPYRPMSLEAAAGKNPVSHVGKLYNVAAHRMASALYERVDGVAEAHCHLLSRIGRPVDDPVVADVRLRLDDGVRMEEVRPAVESVVRQGVLSLPALAEELLAGRAPVF